MSSSLLLQRKNHGFWINITRQIFSTITYLDQMILADVVVCRSTCLKSLYLFCMTESFTLYSMSAPERAKQFGFFKNLNVFREVGQGNIEIRGKVQLFPEGTDIKCTCFVIKRRKKNQQHSYSYNNCVS